MRVTLHEKTRLDYPSPAPLPCGPAPLASDSLAGLSVGDSLGAQYFAPGRTIGVIPPPVWEWTDDTEMACSVVWMLHEASARLAGERPSARRFLEAVTASTPDGVVERGLKRAMRLPSVSVAEAAYELGNGSQVTAQDTVPFTIWVAARHLADYPAAVLSCVEAGGDIDTTAAIVGGIVGAFVGRPGIPDDWLAAREPLPDWLP